MFIKELSLHTADLDATVTFYNGLLEMDMMKRTERSASFKAGDTEIHFEQTEGSTPQYHFAFNIPCNRVDEALQWLEARTPAIEISKGNKIADFTNWNAKSIYFMDKNKNIVEFIGRYDLKNDSQDPFTASSISCVSEIGLVLDNVPDEGAELSRGSGIEYYTKQKPGENFAALGNDHGLLILTNEQRDWYPTEVRVKKFPVKAIIENDHKQIIIQNG